MTDEGLVKRLREYNYVIPADVAQDTLYAADAIERLTRERDDCRKDWLLQSKVSNGYAEALIAAEKERDVAKAKIERLQEALAFYAQHSAYRTCTVYMSGAREITAIERDCGDRARAALKETGDE